MSNSWNWDFRFYVLCFLGIFVLAVFVYRQLRLEHAFIDVSVFRFPMFTTGITMLMISSMSVLGFAFLFPLLLQKGLHVSSMSAALFLLPGAIINGVCSPYVGALLRKRDAKFFLILGFLVLNLTECLMYVIHFKDYLVLFCYALFMFGASMILVPAQTNALNQLPPQNNADGSAILNTLQQLAGAIGTALASSLIAQNVSHLTAQNKSLSYAYVHGFQKSIMLFLVLGIIGLILSFTTKRKQGKVADEME